ncbi:hypothetical protein HNY73_015126 [Argiope bruennichi]|uniref:MATH domain-containing protein n=1 Tax=Argiope bruennichi TaxID=94029 RepID=A0A8T0ER56_ARGBR|nr:hypothetical protein HNY73_015126 [Argiope bruennichi]
MNTFDLKELIQSEDHVLVLKTENFSSGDIKPQEETFIPKFFNGLYAFSVSVFPNGSCPIYAGYVSLVVKSSMTSDQDLTAMGSSNSMCCTASIIDISGERRYSQSFGIDTIIFTDCYIPGLERFIKRSTLLSQKEEFLPDDVLTMRFEFSLKSNQELASLSKIAEFLPSLLVETLNFKGSGIDNNAVCDFTEVFKDIEEKNDDECSGFACAKSLDSYTFPNEFESVQAYSSPFDLEFYKENEGTQATGTEMHAENENEKSDNAILQEYVSAYTSGLRLPKENTDKVMSGIGILKETEEIPTSGDVMQKEIEEKQMCKYEETEKGEESIKIHSENFSEQVASTMNSAVGEQCNETIHTELSKSIDEKFRLLKKTGDDTSKNIIIVVNGHRMFQKSNQSRKNMVYFSLTTDEELYKMFYSIASLEDEPSKSIYRMHGVVPFFINLMDRDENAAFHVSKNEKSDLQSDTEDPSSPSDATCSTKTIRNNNEIADNKESENLQHQMEVIQHLPQKKMLEKKEDRKDESSTEDENDKEHKFDFLIQTADNETILVPFEENKETIGSKLLTASTVFENMLRHPMKERSERRVEMSDATSRTVNNLLSYVDGGKFSDIPLPDAYDLYEAADKYAVKNLMKECSDFMAYIPIRENVWSMVKLAQLHCDDYLLELAERVQTLVLRLEQISLKKRNEFVDSFIDGLLNEISLESKETESDFFAQDFNFYQ